MAMTDNNHTLCMYYFHPKASLIMWVEHFICHWKLALTRRGNLTCYLLEHKLTTLFLLAESERSHHLLILLGRTENSILQCNFELNGIMQCNMELSSPDALKLFSDKPQTPVKVILFPVMMASAHPDLPGPSRLDVAGIGCRSFPWLSLAMWMGTKQLQQPYSQGLGLTAVFFLLLSHFSIKLQKGE